MKVVRDGGLLTGLGDKSGRNGLKKKEEKFSELKEKKLRKNKASRRDAPRSIQAAPKSISNLPKPPKINLNNPLLFWLFAARRINVFTFKCDA